MDLQLLNRQYVPLLYLMLISCHFIGQLIVWNFWMLHSFYKGYIEEGNIQKKCWLREKDARTVQIEKPMADVAAFWAKSWQRVTFK